MVIDEVALYLSVCLPSIIGIISNLGLIISVGKMFVKRLNNNDKNNLDLRNGYKAISRLATQVLEENKELKESLRKQAESIETLHKELKNVKEITIYQEPKN